MTQKHTPGPWEVIRSGVSPTDKMFIRRCALSGEYVAEIKPSRNDPPDEMHANADLIARAPELLAENDRLRQINAELLAALKIWMEFFDTMPKGQFRNIVCDFGLMNDGFIKSARAIARAEGKA